MKRNFIIALAVVVLLALSIIGYGLYVNYKSESVITERMNSRSIVVSAAEVKPRTFKAIYELDEVVFNARNGTDVIAKVDGIITQNYMHKNMLVKPGDALVTLTNEDVPMRIGQAAAELKKAQTAELRAKNRYERYSKLLEPGAVSLEQYDEAKSAYESAVADLESVGLQYQQTLLNESRLHVTTDVGGYVLVIYKAPGSFVTAGTPICMIGDFNKMWYYINMDDSTLKSLLGDERESAKFTLSFQHPDFGKAYGTEYVAGNKGNKSTFTTTIYGIYPPLNQPAEMRRVVFDVDNRFAILEARSYSDVLMSANTFRQMLSVPVEALRNNNDSYSVYIVDENNKLAEKNVKVGAQGEQYAEILEGIKEGERVVISGTEGLKPMQRVEVNMEDM